MSINQERICRHLGCLTSFAIIGTGIGLIFCSIGAGLLIFGLLLAYYCYI